jgi:hypothetical protein
MPSPVPDGKLVDVAGCTWATDRGEVVNEMRVYCWICRGSIAATERYACLKVHGRRVLVHQTCGCTLP